MCIHLEQGKTEHHTPHGRKMKYLVRSHCHSDRQSEQTHDLFTAFKDIYFLFICIKWRLTIGNNTGKQKGCDTPTQNRSREKIKELSKVALTGNPYHQGRNITERRPGTTGIGSDDNVDRSGDQKCFILFIDRDQYGREDQCCGQVVCHRRDEECKKTGDPKELFIGISLGDKPVTQGRKDTSVDHSFNIGHSHHQEEEDLGDLQNKMLHFCFKSVSIQSVHGKIDTYQHKDTRTGQECRLGFIDMILIFRSDEIISYYKNY